LQYGHNPFSLYPQYWHAQEWPIAKREVFLCFYLLQEIDLLSLVKSQSNNKCGFWRDFLSFNVAEIPLILEGERRNSPLSV